MSAPVLSAERMTLVGHADLDGRGDCMHVNVVDGYAYVGHMGHTDLGTSILDVSDPENPRVVAQLPRPPGTHTHKVQVAGDVMLVNHERNRFEASPPDRWSAGVAAYDVSDPWRPRQIGFFPTPGTGTHRMTYWQPPYAYVSATDEGYKGRFLRIVDFSDPAKPREVGRWWRPGQHVAGGETPPPELTDDPTKGFHLHHALVEGDRLYAGWWDAGLVVLDIADPERPVPLSTLHFGAESGNTHTALPLPGRDVVVVTDEQVTQFIGTQRHVWVVDVADPASPKQVSRLPVPEGDYHERRIRFGPHNLHEHRPGSLVDPETVYLTYFAGGVRAYDVSDVTAPREIAHLVPEAPPGRDSILFNDLTVAPDRTVYATDRRGGGLYIIRHER
ncbi:LVIVD repeat-containing protein [Phytohabitans kaempferiae]|uniref:LVIVD repeat-containing protein n=1 Tax=Phytohabitans kaempferiae TaxID=1620943 RepID=A0ABV6M5Z1_9ACTN